MTELINRKRNLEERLERHGIVDYRVQYFPYLDFDDKKFATTYDTGCRMMILYAVAHISLNLDDRESVSKWLKREMLWKHVSLSEKELFEGKVNDKQKIIDFSWQIECAYILAWSLSLIKNTPTPTEQLNKQQLDSFKKAVPSFGEKLGSFLNDLSYRETTEIYDENLFHELATTYYRDLIFNGKKDNSDIDPNISFLRHQTLNWLRRFMDIDDWDETDTST